VPDGPNVGSYCNKQLDALVAQAAGVVDPEQRAAIWKQAAKIENADPSMMWLYSLNNLFGVNKRVQGFQPLNNSNWFEPWKWTWPADRRTGRTAVPQEVATSGCILRPADPDDDRGVSCDHRDHLLAGAHGAGRSGQSADPDRRVQRRDTGLHRAEAPRPRPGPAPDRPVLPLVRNAVQGNLGYSVASGRPVSSMISERISPTIELMGLSLALGILIALRWASWPRCGRTASRLPRHGGQLVTISTPTFFLGIIAIYVFSLKLHLLPHRHAFASAVRTYSEVSSLSMLERTVPGELTGGASPRISTGISVPDEIGGRPVVGIGHA